MLEGIGRFAHSRHGFCVVALCQGKEDDHNFFAFVAIEPHNYRYFKKIYKSGEAPDFSAFGQELLRGPGVTPPKDVIEYVRNKYHIEFSAGRPFMERLLALTTGFPSGSASSNSSVSPFLTSPEKPAEAAGS